MFQTLVHHLHSGRQGHGQSRGHFEICLRTPTKGSPVRISVMELSVISIVVAVAVAFIVAFVTFVLTKLRNQAAETKEQNASKRVKATQGSFPLPSPFRSPLRSPLPSPLSPLSPLLSLPLPALPLAKLT